MRWDYVGVVDEKFGYLLGKINKVGDKGWELVSVLVLGEKGDPNRLVAVLKRPMETMTAAQRAARAKKASKAAAEARKAKAKKVRKTSQ
jgi:hypothetical protein